MESSDSIGLVLRFWQEVWNPPYNLDIIDEILTEDFEFMNAGALVAPRTAFKEWVRESQAQIASISIKPLDTFSDKSGTSVASRWIATGNNNGMFGLPADGRPIELTGISIWKSREGKLASHWVERSALPLYQKLTSR
jgi:SnoaL-like polyketide cyclase